MDSFWQTLAPMMNVRMPAFGNIFMNYTPWTNWGDVDLDAGDLRIEDQVFRRIAMPGKQLGKLEAAVLALIEITEKQNPDLKEKTEFEDLKKLAEAIETKKEELQKTAAGEARTALRRLRCADEQAFNDLMAEYAVK